MSYAKLLMPSAAMADLLVSWGQFTAIFGDLTMAITANVARDFPGVDLSTLAPWAETLNRHVAPGAHCPCPLP